MSTESPFTDKPVEPLSITGGSDVRSWMFRCLWWSVAGGLALLACSYSAACTGDNPDIGNYHFSRLFSLFALVVPLLILGGQISAWHSFVNGSKDAAKSLAFAPLVGLVLLAWPFVVLCGVSFQPTAPRAVRQHSERWQSENPPPTPQHQAEKKSEKKTGS